MAEVIHIDGIGTEPVGQIYIPAGTSLLDLIRQLGGTFRVEQVTDQPRPPRKLDPQAAEFLREYEREEVESVLAIYWRYHSLEAEEFDTVAEAERFIEGGEEYGSLAGEAVVDGDEIKVWD